MPGDETIPLEAATKEGKDVSAQQYLILDYETRSELDLKKFGAYEYARHPSTQILCVAWRVGARSELRGAPTKCWSPAIPGAYGELIRALCDPAIKKVAHNAFFEQVITRFVLTRLVSSKPELARISHGHWLCTASMAAALALPRDLEGVCLALNLPVKKDMEGRRLILKYCKPRRPSLTNPSKWHSSLHDLKRIMEYCSTDIAAETELFLTIPTLHPNERRVWVLDQEINFRGFNVDRKAVQTALGLISKEVEAMTLEAHQLTGGRLSNLNRRQAVLDLLKEWGCTLPDLKAKTVADALSSDYAIGKAARLLAIRQAVSMTSTKKYHAFEQRSRSDGRVRDILMYHAASTGRWGGRGLQPHNFPKGTLKDAVFAAELMADTGDLELLRLLYSDPMKVFSSTLRAMIVPTPGNEFFCGDFNAIETRVEFWLANHTDGIDAFLSGRDLYCEMASVIYGREITKEDLLERDIGKRTILGCGFGMGWKKFKETCRVQANLAVSDDLAEKAVNAYRTIHAPIRALWSVYERAAIYAVKTGKRVSVNHTKWYVQGKFLFCELPSGRRLAYYGPEIRHKLTPWGEKRPVLYHWGVDPVTKKWGCSGTYGGRLTENVVQAVARDFMAEALLRLDARGYSVVLSVHDEGLTERKKGTGSLKEFVEIMETVPEWGKGCPIKVGAWVGERYRK